MGRRQRQRHQNIDQNQSNALNVPVGPSSVEGNSKFLACQDCRGRRLERERKKEEVPSMFSAPKMSPLSNKRTHTYIRVVNSVTHIRVCLFTSIYRSLLRKLCEQWRDATRRTFVKVWSTHAYRSGYVYISCACILFNIARNKATGNDEEAFSKKGVTFVKGLL